ncbi:MAG TPA: type II toxin-antitoxin system RelE/ParE family toxin [Ferruginibacter sp.]|nr:type II toxin-antitoxin system RelE/ParE family toxin [Ferruginibacter sp.]HMP21521.1 type II toxin-antitoxin system RelE/ParE family toxin [Ferruginibacter sp.]
MSYSIKTTPQFDKELKRIASKYPSLKSDFKIFLEEIASGPIAGVALGNNCYKVRLAISSKGKGKSGGARVIIFVVLVKKEILLLSIYDKSEKATISNAEILKRLKPYLEP